MPLRLTYGDITALRADAIVNAADPSLLGGGGVDGAIHAAAGPGLLAECRRLGGCEPGCAKVTAGYDLPCRYVIHTVGPVWHGGSKGEAEVLASCYRASLSLAAERDCESVAFPLISAGVFGYPKDQALRIAVEAIGQFLLRRDMAVTLVLHRRSAALAGEILFPPLARYIQTCREEAFSDTLPGARPPARPRAAKAASALCEEVLCEEGAVLGTPPAEKGLTDALSQLDESFSQMLLRKIDERGMTDAACYKKANIDRRLFSKIRGDIHYRPSKPTALAFAVALELPLPETRELLMKAGFALSHSSKFDIIVEYFIQQGKYDIFEINEALFAFDQCLLGA
ncbi:MAG: macro domain-containing protein [Oscillibacter sp.]|nr:macro domain-containing protein [Oscillibacter sp.]